MPTTAEQQPVTKNKREEIGALWKRVSRQTGGTFFSGKVKINNAETEVVVFENGFKGENERAPDYRIYLSEAPRASVNTGVSGKSGTQGSAGSAGTKAPIPPKKTTKAVVTASDNDFAETNDSEL